MLVHSVYFYLRPGLDASELEAFLKSAEPLREIETVKALHIGTPAAVADRPPLVKDYTAALNVVFETVEDHDIYQAHPLHKAFLERNKPLFEKVVVYDFD